MTVANFVVIFSAASFKTTSCYLVFFVCFFLFLSPILPLFTNLKQIFTELVSLSVSCISRCLMDEAIIASFSVKRNYKQFQPLLIQRDSTSGPTLEFSIWGEASHFDEAYKVSLISSC